MIDSADRGAAYPSPWEFQIVKKQSLFNGFFTRIGATEVVLEWNNPNIDNINNTLVFTLVGATPSVTLTLLPGFYTVADIMNASVARLNQATTAGRFSVVNSNGLNGIVDGNGTNNITVVDSPLKTQMGWAASSGTPFLVAFGPDLRQYRYLDFVSNQLTYNQNIKDATSNLRDQSVLVRWYFAYDNPSPTDQYGYPVLMGYEAFVVRRLYNPPKQIAWENNMPIGQVGFQVYGSDGKIVLDNGDNSQWMMTLQISEN
jgi:hypothetical protein